METYLPISFLNDFIFCPRSIYYHQLYQNFSHRVYHDTPQTKGTNAHKSIDKQTYSLDKSWIIGINVYSDTYKICGKIDLYNTKKKLLRERKQKIKTIYDGYIFQLYAQYVCMTEMGYDIKSLQIYDMTHNTIHPIPLPADDVSMKEKFETTLTCIHQFDLDAPFTPLKAKCMKCIYSSLCDRSPC